MNSRKIMPVTWFTLGIIIADSIITLVLISEGWAYEAAFLRFIELPMWLILCLKVAGSAVGLFVIEWLRQRFEYVRQTAFRAVCALLVIYSTAMLIAWTTWLVRYIVEAQGV